MIIDHQLLYSSSWNSSLKGGDMVANLVQHLANPTDFLVISKHNFIVTTNQIINYTFYTMMKSNNLIYLLLLVFVVSFNSSCRKKGEENTLVNVDQTEFMGTDWALYTPVKKIHLDDDVGLKTYAWTAYKSACSPVICSDYSYDSNTSTETFQILTTKSNRSEIRLEDNYSTGSRQFSGYVKFDAPLNDESLMQIFGSTSENATQLMIRGFAENGGTLKISNSFVLATGVYNKEVHINVIHLQEDVGSKMIVYIDGVKKFEKVDGENATNYMKYGCYGTMKTGKAIVQWRDVNLYKNGTAPD